MSIFRRKLPLFPFLEAAPFPFSYMPLFISGGCLFSPLIINPFTLTSALFSLISTLLPKCPFPLFIWAPSTIHKCPFSPLINASIKTWEVCLFLRQMSLFHSLMLVFFISDNCPFYFDKRSFFSKCHVPLQISAPFPHSITCAPKPTQCNLIPQSSLATLARIYSLILLLITEVFSVFSVFRDKIVHLKVSNRDPPLLIFFFSHCDLTIYYNFCSLEIELPGFWPSDNPGSVQRGSRTI